MEDPHNGPYELHERGHLRVLLVAPVFLPISRGLKYAGTERIIAGLNEKFAMTPHVSPIVAATGDSNLEGKGKLIWIYPKALWSLESAERRIIDIERIHERHMAFCIRYAMENRIDIIHDHAGLAESRAYEMMKSKMRIPVVTTIHGGVHIKDAHKYKIWRGLQRENRQVYFIAISRSQQRQFEDATGVQFTAVVHNGVPVERYPFIGREGKQDYLFWIGRICHDKGADLAIKLAKATGRPLIIAGEVHSPNKRFYEREVKPHITRFIEGGSYEEQEKARDRIVERLAKGERVAKPGEILFIGPLDDRQKGVLYSRAYAQVMLNRWEEPFGLVLPEAMACGTPIIGTRRGAIPEIVVDKVTGFVLPVTWIDLENMVIDDDALISAAAKAVERIPDINPVECRKHVERNFSIDATAKGYLEAYSRILKISAQLNRIGVMRRWNS